MANPVLERLETEARKSPERPNQSIPSGGQYHSATTTEPIHYAQQPNYGGFQNQAYPPFGTPGNQGVSGVAMSAQPQPGYTPSAPFAAAGNLPAADSRPITIDDLMIKTGITFVALLAGAGVSWALTGMRPDIGVGLASVSGIVAFVMVLITSFKSRPSAVMTLIYAVAEGLTLGAISRVFEEVYPGVVFEAVLATLCLFLVCLALFKTGMVRVNGKFARMMMIGLIGIIVYRLVAFLLAFTGLVESHPDQLLVFGLPLGLLVGLIAIMIGSMSLVMDFDTARECIRLGMPKEYAWSCALGFMVTLVWIYIEVLRILVYLRELASD